MQTFVGDVAPIKMQPDDGSEQLSQILHGESVEILRQDGDWCYCRHPESQVSGYIRANDLSPRSLPFTHVVTAPFAHIYAEPSQLKPTSRRLPMHSRIALTGDIEPLLYPSGAPGVDILRMEPDGWIVASAVAPIDQWKCDPVSIAARLINVPYLHGGRCYLGVDEFGLLQVATYCRDKPVPHLRPGDAGSFAGQLSPAQKNGPEPALFRCGERIGLHTGNDEYIYASRQDMLVVRESETRFFERLTEPAKDELRLFEIP